MTGRLVETEGLVQTLVTRKRLKLLAHLPLTGARQHVNKQRKGAELVCA